MRNLFTRRRKARAASEAQISALLERVQQLVLERDHLHREICFLGNLGAQIVSTTRDNAPAWIAPAHAEVGQ